MKEYHKQVENFPKEQVRAAIQAGISQAESQMNSNKVSYKISHKKGKAYMLCQVWQSRLDY